MSDDGMLGHPPGPNGLALVCRDSIVKIEAELETATTKAQKKGLRQRLKLCRDMERWCKTRAGYVVASK